MQIIALSFAVIIFGLMYQARFSNQDLAIPSMLTAVQLNLRMPLPFCMLVTVPILGSLLLSVIMDQLLPPLAIFIIVSTMCYFLANGFVIVVILISQLVFYAAAVVHVFIKRRSATNLID